MPNNKKSPGEVAERLKILEKAVSSLADTLKKRDDDIDEEIGDVLLDLKALKLFLSRNIPEFKKEFPGIQRKLK